MSLKPRVRDYFAGSLVANSPAWLLSIISPYLRATTSEIFVVMILFFTTMAGGVLAGYLVARGAQSEQVKTGLSTGLFSYALYALFLTITGFRGGPFEDIPSITGFVIGGAVGARLREIRVSGSTSPLIPLTKNSFKMIVCYRSLSGDANLSVVGRAMGLMETWDPGYRGYRCREKDIYARPGECLLPGFLPPCSRAGNTPHHR